MTATTRVHAHICQCGYAWECGCRDTAAYCPKCDQLAAVARYTEAPDAPEEDYDCPCGRPVNNAGDLCYPCRMAQTMGPQ